MVILDFNLLFYLIVFVFILSVTMVILRFKKSSYTIKFYALLEIYCLVLSKVVVLPIFILNSHAKKDMLEHVNEKYLYRIQIMPFRTLIDSITDFSLYGLIQIVGNILLLMPLAFTIAWLMNKTNKVFIALCGLVVTCLIELIQLIINVITSYPCHAVDIDDVILNYTGYLIAVLIIWLVKKYNRKSYDKVRRVFLTKLSPSGKLKNK